jgi:hypothetical protein
MAEVRLTPIRPGFDWSVDIEYPSGFLAVDESVRMNLRPYADSAAEAVCSSQRIGDTVTLSLDAAQTALLQLGTLIGEAVIFKPTDPFYHEIPLTTNRFLVECEPSPSE